MAQPHPAVVRALRAVEQAPSSAPAWMALGAAFLSVGQARSALEALERAVRLGPDNALAWSHLGLAKRRAGDHLGGRVALERAVVLAPQDAACWGNLSAARESCGDAPGAAEAALQAARLDPTEAGWWAARGNALRTAGDIPGALAAYDQAEQLAPTDIRVPWNRALALLAHHNFADGFVAYESRRLRPQHKKLPGPVWESGPPPADGVVVHHEQGFGDTLQWARFLPELARHTKRVVVAAPARLHGLLATVPGVHGLVTREHAQDGGALAALGCSAHVGLMSLGALLGEAGPTLAQHIPVFHPPPEAVARWRQELSDGRPLVALTWQGNPSYERDHLRSPPLRAFAPVLANSRVRFISLQKFHGVEQLHRGTGALKNVEDVGARVDLGDHAFVDSAAVMAAADLIITSDTSTAHLAGALGRPTWTVLSTPADWRWGHHPTRTPWYPGMRLFRQPRPGDWTSLFASVAEALETWIGERPSRTSESP